MGGVITWQIPSLAAGASLTLTFNAVVDAADKDGQQLNNLALFSDSSTETGSAPAPTLTVAKPNLAFLKQVSGESDPVNLIAMPGDTLNYQVVITNSGSLSASFVVVSDTVQSSALTNIRNISNGGVLTGGNNTIVWTVTVPAKGSITVGFDATVSQALAQGTKIDNLAIVTPDCTQGSSACGQVGKSQGSYPHR